MWDTPLSRRFPGAPRGGELEVPAPNPAERVAQPEEVAAFALLLSDERPSFITGAALAIDGGYVAAQEGQPAVRLDSC